MFNAGTQSPIVLHLLDMRHIFQENVGDQDQLTVQDLVISHQDPQRLKCVWNTDLEPFQLNRIQAGLARMGEQYLKSDLIRNDPYQILQRFGFPTIQTVVINFHDPLKVIDPKDKFPFQLLYLSKHFLVIQPSITHKPYFILRIQPMRRCKCRLDFFVLANKVGGLV